MTTEIPIREMSADHKWWSKLYSTHETGLYSVPHYAEQLERLNGSFGQYTGFSIHVSPDSPPWVWELAEKK